MDVWSEDNICQFTVFIVRECPLRIYAVHDNSLYVLYKRFFKFFNAGLRDVIYKRFQLFYVSLFILAYQAFIVWVVRSPFPGSPQVIPDLFFVITAGNPKSILVKGSPQVIHSSKMALYHRPPLCPTKHCILQ